MSDLKSTLAYIREEADETDLTYILAAFQERRRFLTSVRAANMREQLDVDDKIIVQGNIKPKYFVGRVGKVLSLQGDRVEVDFGTPMRRYGRIVKVPLSSVRKLS